MQTDAEVLKQVARYEAVEWLYDGLNGKIIPWTKENGGTSDDPSILAFVVGPDGKVAAKCPGNEAYQPKAFRDWLKTQGDAWEREHPSTKVPFARAEAAMAGEGTDRKAVCAALEEAVAAKRPVLLYFGRDSAEAGDRKAQVEAAACRKFEKETLSSTRAAEAAEGWVLLRFDLAGEAVRALALRHGVERGPVLVALVPGEEEPLLFEASTSGGSLAYALKKHGKR